MTTMPFSARHTSSAPSALFAFFAVALPLLAGCSSGRVGAFYLLDDAVAVEDAHGPYQRTAVCSHERVSTLKGLLVPTTAAGRWLVVQEARYAMHPVRTSALRSEQRLPKWVVDRVLRTYDLHTGEMRTLPNPLDSDDEHIMDLRLIGDALFAAVGERLNVQIETAPARCAAYHLPDGPWQPLTPADGRMAFPRHWSPVKFVDLRTADGATASESQEPTATAPALPTTQTALRWGRATSYADLQARGLNSGDWGTLIERQVRDRWEVVLRTPAGREFVLLRQNNGGNAGNTQAWGAVLGLEPPVP